MGRSGGRWRLLPWVVTVLLVSGMVGTAGAQGFPSLTGGPVGSDTVPISSGLFGQYLPRFPNLEFGFLYSFGPKLRAGRFTADYLLPISTGSGSVVFGEAHAEFQNFWKSPSVTTTGGPGFVSIAEPSNNRTDLSFGGGYRTVVHGNTLFGVNAFFDTARVFEKWHSSGGVGLEMVSNLTDNDAVDLRANWYGNLFNREALLNAFRNKGGSFDIEAGFSHGIFEQALDLRLKFVGYQFDTGDAVYGYKGGAELTTRDGVFNVRYEHGYDRINGSYDTIGGFVNMGFQVENLLRGESPITLPEPVFRSPRGLAWWLNRQVSRNWHLPAALVALRRQATSTTTTTTTAGGKSAFTRTALVGIYPGPLILTVSLDQDITAADLAGINSVLITWDGGGVPTPGSIIHLESIGGGCAGPAQSIGGASSPPGVFITNPAFWTIACGPWDSIRIASPTPAAVNFGTVTLTFSP